MAASKKGFDKEYIFNLIMPTSSEEEEPEDLEQRSAPAERPSSAPSGEKEPEQGSEDPSPQDSLSMLRERLNQPLSAPVQLRPAKNLVLVNLVEQLVADRLDAVFEKFNCCRCDKCRRDVAALALNAIPPQYVVAEPEEIPKLLEEAPVKEIPGALVKAILQVKNNPQH